MSRRANITPEIEAAFEEGRVKGIREAVAMLIGIKEVREHEFWRGLWRAVDAEGWRGLTDAEQRALDSAAKFIAASVGDPAPTPDEAARKAIAEKYHALEREQEAAELRSRLAHHSQGAAQ